MDIFSTELVIRLSFVISSEFRGGGAFEHPPSVRHCLAVRLGHICDYLVESERCKPYKHCLTAPLTATGTAVLKFGVAVVHQLAQHCAVRDFVWTFRNKIMFLRWGPVSTSPSPRAGGQPLVGCPRLLIQYIRSYPPYCRPFLHPQPEDAPCRGDRTHLSRHTLHKARYTATCFGDGHNRHRHGSQNHRPNTPIP
jgi:hypothetical protein